MAAQSKQPAWRTAAYWAAVSAALVLVRLIFLRLTMRARIAAVIITIAAAALLDAQTDIFSCALHIPAMRAWNSPAFQDGFELVRIERGAEYNIVTATPAGNEMNGFYPSMQYGSTVLVVRCHFKPKLTSLA